MSVSNPRIEVKDAAAGWFGARESAQLPVRATDSPGVGGSGEASTQRTSETRAQVWLRRGRRIVIDLAIVLAAMTAVPVLLVSIAGTAVFDPTFGNLRARLQVAEATRPFALPKDPSITPIEAGRAFASLQQARPDGGFQLTDVPHPAATWRNVKLGSMFPAARPSGFDGPNGVLLLDAVRKGFTAGEMEYLRVLATAPVWKPFDLVARAPAVDILGGEFILPFKRDANVLYMPSVRFAGPKDLAYAAIDRAAYQLAIGRPDSAETILRSIISFGFNIVDNGTTAVDAMIGRVIVGIGRDGLEHFYMVTRDPRAAAVIEAQASTSGTTPSQAGPTSSPARRQNSDESRSELLATAANPRETRGIRYHSLQALAMSSCTNVRELLFGRRPDVRQAFEAAKNDLARFPSERALVDIISKAPSAEDINRLGTFTPVRRFLVGTSSIAGAVLGNPRLATCTWVVTEGRMGF